MKFERKNLPSRVNPKRLTARRMRKVARLRTMDGSVAFLAKERKAGRL